mmetsp:Transcript_2578/g.9110  ORF Transcript_2578/g.9110 Transcript_2578/m.9110 type:complete len:304 (-) Transcript_2578:560-1471(-)
MVHLIHHARDEAGGDGVAAVAPRLPPLELQLREAAHGVELLDAQARRDQLRCQLQAAAFGSLGGHHLRGHSHRVVLVLQVPEQVQDGGALLVVPLLLGVQLHEPRHNCRLGQRHEGERHAPHVERVQDGRVLGRGQRVHGDEHHGDDGEHARDPQPHALALHRRHHEGQEPHDDAQDDGGDDVPQVVLAVPRHLEVEEQLRPRLVGAAAVEVLQALHPHRRHRPLDRGRHEPAVPLGRLRRTAVRERRPGAHRHEVHAPAAVDPAAPHDLAVLRVKREHGEFHARGVVTPSHLRGDPVVDGPR